MGHLRPLVTMGWGLAESHAQSDGMDCRGDYVCCRICIFSLALDLHLIADNYATHKTSAVKRWLKAHPRFHLHFTPTSASWLNMLERFFAEITRNRIRRGAFTSVAELKSAIMESLENHSAAPKACV